MGTIKRRRKGLATVSSSALAHCEKVTLLNCQSKHVTVNLHCVLRERGRERGRNEGIKGEWQRQATAKAAAGAAVAASIMATVLPAYCY